MSMENFYGPGLFIASIGAFAFLSHCNCKCCCKGAEKPKADNKASIYDRIGGQAAVNAAVDIFYKKVISDDRVNHFFSKTNMKAQRAKQAKFLAFVMGGPEKWKGMNMKDAHKGMKITEEHFGAIAGNLQSTLEELKVPVDIINEIMTIAASTHDDIVHPSG